MRETFVPSLGRTQLMTWPEDDSVPFQLRGVPKDLKQILMERGLWPANYRRSDGFAFLTQCPTTGGRRDGNLSESIPRGCCARSVMANEPDFWNQKGRLEEELENKGQLVIFYPNFTASLTPSRGIGVGVSGMPGGTAYIPSQVCGKRSLRR